MERQRVRVKAAPARALLTVVPMDRPVNPEVLATLESLIIMAADGRLCSVALAGVHRDGSVTTAFVSGGRCVELMGATTVVQHRMQKYFEA